MKQYHAIGIMSGSSLDGLDVCLSTFSEGLSWSYTMLKSETIEIPDTLKSRLRESIDYTQEDIKILDFEYGKWIGEKVKDFIRDIDVPVDLVAVHGHTLFHQPENGISLQLGDGDQIAAQCGIPVIDRFRIDDIRKGGQGAPLVPVGEYYLFSGYQALVNLGGICNITILQKGNIKAWDIAPCNQVLNHCARFLGHEYDPEGALASMGDFNHTWNEALDQLDFFNAHPPKSLSNQWGVNHIISRCQLPPYDALATYTRFVAGQIAKNIEQISGKSGKVMFSGGGAFNQYLMELVREMVSPDCKIELPSPEIICYKEALIFAFLGLLKFLDRPNVFASVTGATSDTIAGTVHLPSQKMMIY